MELRVIVKQRDLESRGLTAYIQNLSRSVMEQGDSIVIIPGWNYAGVAKALTDARVSFGVENIHLAGESDGYPRDYAQRIPAPKL